MNYAMTLTFGDQAENHTGMEVLGNAAESGFSHDDLKNIQKLIGPEQNKYPTIETELIDLRDLVDVLPEGCSELEGAYVLILIKRLSRVETCFGSPSQAKNLLSK